MDDVGRYLATLVHRTDTPYRNPDGSLSPDAQRGETLFHDPAVGCADCHTPPFFTDSRLETPFIKHDVRTALVGDPDALGGFDTPSLIGVWDTAPYLHHHQAQSLEEVLTIFNTGDDHGTTSHLDPEQIGQLAAYLRSIAWPESAECRAGTR